MDAIEAHPVQTHQSRQGGGKCPKSVTLRAYEVYQSIYGPQEALITNGCRGGFSTRELIAFLFARSFPKDEWGKRVDQAMTGMEHL